MKLGYQMFQNQAFSITNLEQIGNEMIQNESSLITNLIIMKCSKNHWAGMFQNEAFLVTN